jgi:O-succinylbenzoic acid--CoA ligase
LGFMLTTDEFEWDYQTFEAHVEGMCSQIAAHPSNKIVFHAPLDPLTILTLFATWKVGKTACPINPKIPTLAPTFIPSWPTPCAPTPTQWDLDLRATELYTSGSSGKPKIACHTLKNHVLSARGSFVGVPLTENSCWNLVIPLYHVGGLGILFRCYLAKARLLLSQNMSRATHISLVPTQLYRLRQSGAPLPPTVLIGGAPLPPSEPTLIPTYGMTEMSSQIVTNHAIHPYAEMILSQQGEVWVRGAVLFQGYLQDQDLHLPLNDQGWLETGDLGEWKEGRFNIIGRKDNLFISGGENIQPEEIEAAIREYCNIFDAVVVPLQDEEFGARPAVFLSNPELLPLIQSKLQEALPKFKIPVQAFQLPENTGLKPPRKKLQKSIRDC